MANKHGYFADPETGEPLADGVPVVHCDMCRDGTRDIVLTQPVLYVDPDGVPWRVPVGFRSNGLSVPWVCFRISQPFEPLSREASVVHDRCCTIRWVPWKEGAWVFYHAMRANGVGPVRAWIRWAAVYFVGGPWNWLTTTRRSA